MTDFLIFKIVGACFEKNIPSLAPKTVRTGIVNFFEEIQASMSVDPEPNQYGWIDGHGRRGG